MNIKAQIKKYYPIIILFMLSKNESLICNFLNIEDKEK